VAAVVSPLHCPYCAHAFAVDAATIGNLGAYQHQVQSALGRADEHLVHADAWRRVADPVATRRQLIVTFVVIGGFFVLLGAVFWVTSWLGLSFEPALMGLFPVVMFVLMGLVFALQPRAQAGKAAADDHTVACPSCGAPSVMGVGQAAVRCRHCGGALVASKEVVAAGIGAVQAVHWSAKLARHREERRGMVRMSSWSVSHLAPFLAVGSFGLMILLTAVGQTVAVLAGFSSLELAPLLTLWTMASAFVAVLGAMWHVRRTRRRQFEEVLSDLAVQIGGRRTARLEDVVSWLDEHWPADYALAWLRPGPHHGAVLGTLYGMPCMLQLDPHGDGSHQKAHANLVIAAWAPDAPGLKQARRDPNLAASFTWLRDTGFEVRLEACGVMATATAGTVERIRKHPTLAHLLVTVLTTLAGVAQRRRAGAAAG
jgi:hypothetical protein